MCAGADMAQLTGYIEQIMQFREEYGTGDRPFRVYTTGQNAFTQERIQQLEALGVTDIVIAFRNVYAMEPDHSITQKLEMMNWYASEFLT